MNSVHRLFIKKYWLVAFWLLLPCLAFAQENANPLTESSQIKKYSIPVVTTDETARCLGCHSTKMPKLVENWEKSTHAKNRIGCYECHRAEKGDMTSKQGHFGFNVQLPVSSARCGSCHQEQYETFASSAHATAFERIKDHPIRKSNPAVFEASCAVCHGTEVKMYKGKTLENTWPNSGIGRVNTDKSLGSCAACHGAHSDSLSRVRDANTCGKCHSTNFSPAMQSWGMSAHGNATNDCRFEKVDFAKKHLNLSEDPILKPNCQSCHMMAADKLSKATHNVSSRLS